MQKKTSRLAGFAVGTVATATFALGISSPARAADPIVIGMVTESTGPNAEAGLYQMNGAKLAVDEINQAGGVLGRPIKLITEDNQSTNPGSVLA
ncbi:MAG TPA: ABC transporter substrate-binding protein, partial [Paraburkholderia sp.]